MFFYIFIILFNINERMYNLFLPNSNLEIFESFHRDFNIGLQFVFAICPLIHRTRFGLSCGQRCIWCIFGLQFLRAKGSVTHDRTKFAAVILVGYWRASIIRQLYPTIYQSESFAPIDRLAFTKFILRTPLKK